MLCILVCVVVPYISVRANVLRGSTTHPIPTFTCHCRTHPGSNMCQPACPFHPTYMRRKGFLTTHHSYTTQISHHHTPTPPPTPPPLSLLFHCPSSTPPQADGRNTLPPHLSRTPPPWAGRPMLIPGRDNTVTQHTLGGDRLPPYRWAGGGRWASWCSGRGVGRR